MIASIYYENMDEISAIISEDDFIRERFAMLVGNNLSAVKALVKDGSVQIGSDNLLDMHTFLINLQKHGSLRMRQQIDFILSGIESGWLLPWLGITVIQ